MRGAGLYFPHPPAIASFAHFLPPHRAPPTRLFPAACDAPTPPYDVAAIVARVVEAERGRDRDRTESQTVERVRPVEQQMRWLAPSPLASPAAPPFAGLTADADTTRSSDASSRAPAGPLSFEAVLATVAARWEGGAAVRHRGAARPPPPAAALNGAGGPDKSGFAAVSSPMRAGFRGLAEAVARRELERGAESTRGADGIETSPASQFRCSAIRVLGVRGASTLRESLQRRAAAAPQQLPALHVPVSTLASAPPPPSDAVVIVDSDDEEARAEPAPQRGALAPLAPLPQSAASASEPVMAAVLGAQTLQAGWRAVYSVPMAALFYYNVGTGMGQWVAPAPPPGADQAAAPVVGGDPPLAAPRDAAEVPGTSSSLPVGIARKRQREEDLPSAGPALEAASGEDAAAAAASKSRGMWQCASCTLLNSSRRKKCSACNTAKTT